MITTYFYNRDDFRARCTKFNQDADFMEGWYPTLLKILRSKPPKYGICGHPDIAVQMRPLQRRIFCCICGTDSP